MSDIGYIRDGRIPAEDQLVGVALDKTFTDIDKRDEYTREGDTLHIETIEVVAKSPSELYGFLERQVERGVTVKFHKEGIFFTNSENDLMSHFVLNALEAYAKLDWSFIKGEW